MVFHFYSLVRLAGDLPMQIKELYSCALISMFTNGRVKEVILILLTEFACFRGDYDVHTI